MVQARCRYKENTPADYVERLVGVFRELRRVLRDDGVLWLNMGDSYSNTGKHGGKSGGKNEYSLEGGYSRKKLNYGVPCKNLLGMPWRVALALQDNGWCLRQDVMR